MPDVSLRCREQSKRAITEVVSVYGEQKTNDGAPREEDFQQGNVTVGSILLTYLSGQHAADQCLPSDRTDDPVHNDSWNVER